MGKTFNFFYGSKDMKFSKLLQKLILRIASNVCKIIAAHGDISCKEHYDSFCSGMYFASQTVVVSRRWKPSFTLVSFVLS